MRVNKLNLNIFIKNNLKLRRILKKWHDIKLIYIYVKKIKST